MKVRKPLSVLMRCISMLLISWIFLSISTIVNAQPGQFNPQTDILIDNFQDAQGGDPYSGGRYWYSFGDLTIEGRDHTLLVAGIGLKNWSGFGIEPYVSGENGAIINTGGKSLLCVEFNGTTPILEVYDSVSKKTEHRGTKAERWVTYQLPESSKNANILSKIQFKFAPGTISSTITKIYFTDK